MKRTLCIILVLYFVLGLAGCGITRGAVIDCGSSELYTQEELKEAAQLIVEEFRSFAGCRLYSLSYAGDQISEKELLYYRSHGDSCAYEGCIVFESEFRSPLRGGGGWSPNRIYTWRWYVTKEQGKEWQLTGYGYG